MAADRVSRRVIAAAAYAASLVAFAAGESFALLVLAGFVMWAASTAMVDAAEVARVELAGHHQGHPRGHRVHRVRIPVAIGVVADRAGLVVALGAYGILGTTLVGLAWREARPVRLRR